MTKSISNTSEAREGEERRMSGYIVESGYPIECTHAEALARYAREGGDASPYGRDWVYVEAPDAAAALAQAKRVDAGDTSPDALQPEQAGVVACLLVMVPGDTLDRYAERMQSEYGGDSLDCYRSTLEQRTGAVAEADWAAACEAIAARGAVTP